MNFGKIERVTLQNGLRILMLPDDHNRSASVSIWIGSGSRFEIPERSGASHYIEHMLFKGTQRRTAREIAQEMDSIGGQFNAYTTKEYTCVYCRALDSHIPMAFDLIADMVTSPLLAQEDMETERGVILEEIGMYEDSPEDLMLDGIYAAAWGGSMLGANILGTRATVGAMSTDQLRAHMSEQYTAPRIVCAVSGAFDRDDFLRRAEAMLGSIPSGGAPFEAQVIPWRSSVSVIPKDFEQNHICIGFPSIARGDDRRFALAILNSICGATTSSRLFQRIREELGLAYSVGSSVTHYMCEGMFEVDAAVSPHNEERALREMISELCILKRDGVTKEEFLRAKEQHKASIIMGLEGNSSVSAHMGRGELLSGIVRSEDEILRAIDSVTIEQVNEMARTFIDFDKISICAVGKVRDENNYIGVVNSSII
ncbi:MAG: insulinase family protein [Clostridia bacterium]|nr:insulinase family protein [Clostridia bacterium]